MLDRRILISDVFLHLSHKEQCLYLHLLLNADDDGFIGNPLFIAERFICNGNDIQTLINLDFLIGFDDSHVVVIKDWPLEYYNSDSDYYTPTIYQNEKTQLVYKNQHYEIKRGEACQHG